MFKKKKKHELWALLNFLLPELFASSEDFENLFEFDSGEQENATEADRIRLEKQVVSQLHKVFIYLFLPQIKV